MTSSPQPIFARFAEHDFAGYSRVYTALSRALAEDPAPARALAAAPDRPLGPLLFFAAVQYVLRTEAPDHPLAAYYPTLGGRREPDAGLVPALVDVTQTYPDLLALICAERAVQTNEARRTALLRPGLGLAAGGGRPLALVELGTSAGLLLLPDRYGYRYHGSGRELRAGRPDAPPALVMECEVRGDGWPEPAATEPVVADRVGLDLNPLSPGDPDAVAWLRSCVWPEHVERLARLDAALAEVASVHPRVVAGDMVANLPSVLSAVDDGVLPVVFSSNALIYLAPAARQELFRTLAEVGRRRDLAVLVNEEGVPALAHWRSGRPTVLSLGRAGPHGEWLTWSPYAVNP